MKREFYLRLVLVLGFLASWYGGYYVYTHPHRSPVEETTETPIVSDIAK